MGENEKVTLTKQNTVGTNFKNMTFLLNIKIFFYFEGGQTPAEFALRRCGAFFCVDVQNPVLDSKLLVMLFEQ